MQNKKAVGKASGELQKSRSQSQQRQASDSSSHSRRVGFKSNVAVYRFDSDGEDSAGYSSTVSETSEQLDGRPRRQSQPRHRRQSHPQPGNDRPAPPPVVHDAAASWEAARGWSSAADRAAAVSPRYAADASHDRHHLVADNVPAPTRVRSNSLGGGGRSQLATITRTLYVSDYDEDADRRLNGSIGGRTLKYDHHARLARDHTQSQQHLSCDDGFVLSCGSVAVHNPHFIDRAHYEYVQVGLVQCIYAHLPPAH